MGEPRSESDIFYELEKLCTRQGYAHVIAYFCFRDNTTSIGEELTSEAIIDRLLPERLIRTEISTLVGLLVKNKIDFTLPAPDDIQEMINQTQTLLGELHLSLSLPMRSHLKKTSTEINTDPFSLGSVLREPIFYGGESAYDFQYLEFAREKYCADNPWLTKNKGFGIDDAEEVVRKIIEVHLSKLLSHFENLRNTHPDNWTMLPAFIFNLADLVQGIKINPLIIKNILTAFSFPVANRNEEFTALNEFNLANACPLIPLDNDQFLLFQHYSLAEALYESPFYWLNEDMEYSSEASKNRGEFVEKFSANKLKYIFGDKNVFMNLDIYDHKRPKKGHRGEIDVLVVFGDRAIILQAKSKRLTLGARKGNDKFIQKDFASSIQDAYDQGLLCAKLLSDENNILTDSNSNNIDIKRKFREIYIFCVISDHYPALSFQASQFLKWEQVDNIKPPFIMDIFNLDVMSEMLQSPLFFLSYVNRRTNYINKISAHHEITILSFFLKHNPLLKEVDFIYLDDSISSDIDSAMMVRRSGLPGKSIPDGIVAQLMCGHIGKILKLIGKSDDPVAIDFGFLLLTLGQDSIKKIEDGLATILTKSRNDHSSSDLSISIGNMETGFTVHINNRPANEALLHLQGHCKRRKYIEKAISWYGLCIHPDNETLRFVVKGEYPWVQSDEMDSLIKSNLLRQKKIKGGIKKRNKIGVNERCPCGSGLKYKKCCKK